MVEAAAEAEAVDVALAAERDRSAAAARAVFPPAPAIAVLAEQRLAQRAHSHQARPAQGLGEAIVVMDAGDMVVGVGDGESDPVTGASADRFGTADGRSGTAPSLMEPISIRTT